MLELGRRNASLLLGALLAILLPFSSATGLQAEEEGPVELDPPPEQPFSRMEHLLEKTIFQINVLHLELRFGPETSEKLRSIAAGESWTAGRADAISRVALSSQNVWAELTFRRGVKKKRFIGGVRDNLERALEDDIIDRETYRTVYEGIPEWFDFLDDRGIEEGDRILYRIRGERLRTRYQSHDGRLLLDKTDAGDGRRRALLGGWFADGSDFREGLTRSLFE